MLRDSAVFKRTALQFVAVSVVVFALHACGGGGGGGGSNAQLSPRSRQAIQAATQATSIVPQGPEALRSISQVYRSLGGRSHKPRSGKITRQGDCPEISFDFDAEDNLVVAVDYGAGCTDEDGDFIRGSYTLLLVSGAEFDEDDNLVSGILAIQYSDDYSENGTPIRGSLVLALNDFVYDEDGNPIAGTMNITSNNYVEGDKLFDGSIELTFIDAEIAVASNVSIEMTLQTGTCSEEFTFEGTIVFDSDGSATCTGEGTYANSAGVEVDFAMEDARFEDNCDYPKSGAYAITDGSTVFTLNFTSTCGRAQLSVDGGSPQQVDLGGLPELPPCGQ